MDWLKGPHALVLTAVLVAQSITVYGVSRQERTPLRLPLASAPRAFGAWAMVQEGVVDKEVREVLRADEVLSRTYRSPDGAAPASLFVAYFKTQRTGATPHSPKNCLPGSGWVPSVSDKISISIPGRAEPIRVNRYLVSRGDARSLVLYWYQSHGRVIAGELEAKLYLVADAIRYNRTDTALVRVVVPLAAEDSEAATSAAIQFVRSLFAPLSAYVGG
jgi:EpsI family protein